MSSQILKKCAASFLTEKKILDLQPKQEDFLEEVLQGLTKTPKELPTKYLYDERGSNLYEQICSLKDYYIPRLEIQIMEDNIREIVGLLDLDTNLIEYGCGGCTKTRILLDNMPELAAYIPIDISREQLLSVTNELSGVYPQLQIVPVCADFTKIIVIDFCPQFIYITRFNGNNHGNFS